MQENVLPVYQGPKALLSALKSLHGEITTASQRMETAGEMDQIIFQKIFWMQCSQQPC